MNKEESQFTGLRRIMFPVHNHELGKLLPMFVLSFLVCFNYSLLRNLKDSLVITAESSGAEVIPFIKLWGILPAAIFMTSLFSFLSNRYSRPKVFTIFLGGFLTYFALFAFLLFPLRDLVHPHELCDRLQVLLPDGFMGMVAMFRNWTLSLFYIIAEMWGTVVLGILFWGFANEIMKVNEARRFYGVLGIGSNLAAICAGLTGMALSFEQLHPLIPLGATPAEQSLIAQASTILISGVGILFTYYWMIRRVLPDTPSTETVAAKKKKKRMGFLESLNYVRTNSYLRNLAIIVVSYNLVINLVEVIWKGQLRSMYPAFVDYSYFMNFVTVLIGALSASTALFMATIIRKLGWTRTALIAPVVLLVTSMGFFAAMLLPEGTFGVFAMVGISSPLALVVFFGAAQNCFSKAAKYSVFDTTKEIAFIPLDSIVKLRGKAAIDGIGSRFGKWGSSLIQTALLLSMGSLSAIAPIVCGILVLVVGGWFYAVTNVGRDFNKLVAELEEEPAEEEVVPESQILAAQ